MLNKINQTLCSLFFRIPSHPPPAVPTSAGAADDVPRARVEGVRLLEGVALK